LKTPCVGNLPSHSGKIDDRSHHLPTEVLQVLLADLGVEVVDEETEEVQRTQPLWHVARADAGEKLLYRKAGHSAVGRVDVELGDGAGKGLDTPSAGQAATVSICSESHASVCSEKKFSALGDVRRSG
jgi:hypothetical protein